MQTTRTSSHCNEARIQEKTAADQWGCETKHTRTDGYSKLENNKWTKKTKANNINVGDRNIAHSLLLPAYCGMMAKSINTTLQ